MNTIVCYGDSNTWGYDPSTGGRYNRGTRYPGRLQALFGGDYHVIENGVNGRTASQDDPIEPHRNGFRTIDVCMLSAMPVDLVTIMLGSNDMKFYLSSSAFIAGKGIELIAQRASDALYGPSGNSSQILIISPPPIADHIEKTELGNIFDAESAKKSRALAEQYAAMADLHGYYFMDASKVCSVSDTDALHLTGEAHMHLADALYKKITEIFSDEGY
jgi:lysophospholipase L1-like esterase